MTIITGQMAVVLRHLREAGKVGVSNVKLNALCFRYGARLWDLKKLGYEIEKECTDSKHGGYTYRLVSEPVDEMKVQGSTNDFPDLPSPTI